MQQLTLCCKWGVHVVKHIMVEKKGGEKKGCLDIFPTNQLRFCTNQSFRVLSVRHGLTHDVVLRGQGIRYEM